MKKLFFAIMVFLSIATFAQTVVGPTGVERPTLKIGDSWNYRIFDGLTGVTSNESAREVTEVSNEGVTFVSKYKSGAPISSTVHPFEKGIATSNSQLKFPLYVGEQWDVKADFGTSAGYHGTQELKATVAGWEEVKVPAGAFSALKITWEGFYSATSSNGSAGGTGCIEIVRWYAPAAKQVIKEVYKQTFWGCRVRSIWNGIELMTYKLVD